LTVLTRLHHFATATRETTWEQPADWVPTNSTRKLVANKIEESDMKMEEENDKRQWRPTETDNGEVYYCTCHHFSIGLFFVHLVVVFIVI
jgi:hypothetical protein